jgi:hypothetical protein
MISVQQLGRKLMKFDPGLFVPLERRLLRNAVPSFAMPLVATVSPPRVGSTLAAQILVQSLEFFYLTNLQYVFFRSPYVAFRFTRFLFPASKNNLEFKSKYGYTPGLNAPCEANEFWKYWFDFDQTERPPKPDPQQIEHIGRVLASIHNQVSQPLLTSCTRLAFYMEELRRRFRQVFFVRVRRDPLGTISSILRGREILEGDINRWWAPKPVECVQLQEADPHTQVALQVLAMERRIDQYIVSHPAEVLQVEYEELCANPLAFVDAVRQFLEAGGVEIKKRKNFRLPTRFAVSRSDENTELSRRLRTGLQQAEALLLQAG